MNTTNKDMKLGSYPDQIKSSCEMAVFPSIPLVCSLGITEKNRCVIIGIVPAENDFVA